MLALRFVQLRRHRVVSVDALHRGELGAARRFVRQIGLQEIQVQRVARGHHHIVTMRSRFDAAFDAAPRHHGGFRWQTAFDDFVPADQLAVVRFQVFFQTLEHVRLQCFLVLQTQFADIGLHLRRILPLVLHCFVATDVDVLAREHLHDFGQDVFQELQRFIARIEQVRIHAPVGGRLRRAIHHTVFRIGGNGGLRMAGNIHFRHHGDVACGGVGDHVADLLLRIETAVQMRRAVRVDARFASGRTTTADFGQLRVALDFHAPALVIGEMPMEGVELVRCHGVEQRLDLLDALEVAGRVEHEAAPGKARRVLDAHRREADRVGGIAGQQLPQRHRAVEQAAVIAGFDHDAVAVHPQRIGFGGRAFARGNAAEFNGVLAGLLAADLQLERRGVGQQRGELRSDRAGVTAGDNAGGRIHREAACRRLHRHRARNDAGTGQFHRLNLGRNCRRRSESLCAGGGQGNQHRGVQGVGGKSVSGHHDSLLVKPGVVSRPGRCVLRR
ncbi:hypothetical protein D3C71_830290 [compost metagenome]